MELPVKADVAYTTAVDVFARIKETRGDGLIVAGVPATAVGDLDREREARGQHVRFLFLAKQKTLFVTIPTPVHKSMHSYLGDCLILHIAQMGLFNSWESVSASRFPAKFRSSGDGDGSGEADGGGKPWPEQAGENQWPTIVIEAGFTQTLPSLHQKMRFWFSRSSHDVKIVVLLKAFPDSASKHILVELWEERPRHAPRPGATSTRSMDTLVPMAVQKINIVWALGLRRIEPANFNVTRGPLKLAFKSLFLRPAVGPQEHDIVFPDAQLQLMAARVWRKVSSSV